MKKLFKKWQSLPRDFLLFLAAVSIFSFSQSIVDSTFNNFLNETFKLTNFQRGLLELPREMPGFLVIFVSALLFFLCSRRLASLANIIMAAGILFIGLFSVSFSTMVLWLFLMSVGQHLFLPLNSSIGMELSKDGKTGRVLGQLSGAGNIFAIAGSFVILLGFKFFNFNFKSSFAIASVGFFIASIFIFMMRPDKPQPAISKFKLKKEYGLFYWLSILYGTRKQIFITFAPWGSCYSVQAENTGTGKSSYDRWNSRDILQAFIRTCNR